MGASNRVVVDPAGWDRTARTERPLNLAAVERATIEGEQLQIEYVSRDGSTTQRIVHPLGLVAKGSTWYLLAGTEAGQRTFRVDRIADARTTGVPADRPDGFDLADAWAEVVDHVDRIRAPVVASGRAAPDAVPMLRAVLGTRVATADVGEPRGGGHTRVVIRGHSVRSLAAEIAGFGRWLTIDDPPELRRALAEIGAELVATYA